MKKSLLGRSKESRLICDEVFAEFYFRGRRNSKAYDSLSSEALFYTERDFKNVCPSGHEAELDCDHGGRSRITNVMDRLETMADTFLSCHIPIQEALPILFEEGKEFLKSYKEEVNSRRTLAMTLFKPDSGN